MTTNGKASSILAGDMNIDIIKFENEGTMNYLTTLFSYRFLPYITLPSRIMNFSATCFDHVFVCIADNKKIKPADIASGLLFKDITDHPPCFISIKCGNHNTKMSRPLTRVFGDKNCQRFIESMQAENWQALYEPDADWYSRFITVVKRKFETCFPLVRVSRKRIKDRPWITTGLKLSIKQSHRLYRNALQDSWRSQGSHSSETWTQYVVQPTQCINQLSSWYGTTFRKKSRKLFRDRDLILMKLKPHVSLAGSSTYSPFRVFLSTRGPKIAQAWQKSIGVKTLIILVCVPNLRPLYNLQSHECR